MKLCCYICITIYIKSLFCQHIFPASLSVCQDMHRASELISVQTCVHKCEITDTGWESFPRDTDTGWESFPMDTDKAPKVRVTKQRCHFSTRRQNKLKNLQRTQQYAGFPAPHLIIILIVSCTALRASVSSIWKPK